MVKSIKEIVDHYRDMLYFWPANSCVSVIKQLSHIEPDYSEWEAISEKECAELILKMPGDFAENYVKCHQACLGDGWVEVPNHDHGEGDIVFARTAWGTYTTSKLKVIDWRLPDTIPATMFCDGNSGYWTWSPEHGLKKAHGFGEIIKVLRRADK